MSTLSLCSLGLCAPRGDSHYQTHWPSANFAHAAPPAEEERAWPATEPSSGWTDDFLRLAGAKAYE